MAEAFLETPVGWLQLVAENSCITRLRFLDEKPAAMPDLTSEILKDAIGQLSAYFSGAATHFPFIKTASQQGTAFQHRVWNELLKIGYGATISYRELSIRLGDEKCIRAAASANGQNNFAIAIPCHRVIGSNGSLTGYAGGLWRKKWLLEHEARHSGKFSQASLFG